MLENVSEFIPGRLYQGNIISLLYLPFQPDLHIHMATECNPIGEPAKQYRKIKLQDQPWDWRRNPGEIKILEAIASSVRQELYKGKKGLITCFAGLNRSGLMTGIILKKMGLSGKEAVRVIREMRSSRCLSNKSFEEFLLYGVD